MNPPLPPRSPLSGRDRCLWATSILLGIIIWIYNVEHYDHFLQSTKPIRIGEEIAKITVTEECIREFQEKQGQAAYYFYEESWEVGLCQWKAFLKGLVDFPSKKQPSKQHRNNNNHDKSSLKRKSALFDSDSNEATHGASGCVMWIQYFSLAMPLKVLQFLEGSRPDARGLILRHPFVCCILEFLWSYQLGTGIGTSIVIPLLWIPSYIVGRGRSGGTPLPSLYAAVPLLLPLPLLGWSLFALVGRQAGIARSSPFVWNLVSTCLMGGPASPLVLAVLWALAGLILPLFSDPDSDPTTSPPPQAGDEYDEDVVKEMKEQRYFLAERATIAYGATGMLTIVFWMWMWLVTIFPTYVIDLDKNLGDLWNYFVWPPNSLEISFLTVNTIVLWLSGLLVIYYHQPSSVLEAVGLSCVFGPSASQSLILSGLQVDDEMDQEHCNARMNAPNRGRYLDTIGEAAADALDREEYEQSRKLARESGQQSSLHKKNQ